MLDKTVSGDGKYVSCIKINGVPILPPVVTNAKRKELLKYKHQAVKLEKRLKREKELREYINRYYLPKLDDNNVLTESLEHKLAFLDEVNLVPTSSDESCGKRQLNLSCDLQVSQYTNNEFKVITNFENHTSQIRNIVEEDPTIPTPNSDDIKVHNETITTKLLNDNELDDIINDDFDETGKPRLIRSNSYVLETPSPMLLAHLKSNSEHTRLAAGKEIITSTPNEEGQDKLNLTKSDFMSETESELKNISDDNSTQDDVTVLPRDVSLHETTVVENCKGNLENEVIRENQECNGVEKDFITERFGDLSLDQQDKEKLTNILNAIPEAYSKQILELLEKQNEQTYRSKSCMNMNDKYMGVADLAVITAPYLNFNPQNERSVYYTPDSFESPHNQIYHCSNVSNVQMMNDNNKMKSNATCLPVNIINIEHKALTVIKAKSPKSCTRQLFREINSTNKEKDWAASVIQAYVKGYLTRRLLRTERVQGLIQTIKDALICAMELHSECVDNINESDVELHRRLIQQVSAAVDAFHDVFFKTTSSEQMAIIRIDRERLIEKLNRPRSKSVSSRSSRSSRRS